MMRCKADLWEGVDFTGIYMLCSFKGFYPGDILGLCADTLREKVSFIYISKLTFFTFFVTFQ